MATNTKNVLFTKAEADCPLGRGNAAARRHFGCSIGYIQKLSPLAGKVATNAMSRRKGLHRGCCCLRQPLSQTFGSTAPRPGSLLGDVQTLTLSLPHRGRWILRSKRRREFAPYRASSILFKNSSSGAKRRLCSLPLRRNMSVCEDFALSVLSAPARVKGMPSG